MFRYKLVIFSRKMKTMTLKEFEEEIKTSLPTFVKNMENLNFVDGKTFPEWFQMYMHWSEVGTDMEEEYWSE